MLLADSILLLEQLGRLHVELMTTVSEGVAFLVAVWKQNETEMYVLLVASTTIHYNVLSLVAYTCSVCVLFQFFVSFTTDSQ